MAKPLALITGASSGIGLELARQFADHDHDLIVAAENDEIATAAQELRAHGSSVEAVRADLSTFAGVEELYRTIAGREIEAVAINAGIGVSGRFIETDLDAELRLISLNVMSTVHLAKRVLTDMAMRGHGRVLFTASVASTMPGPYYAVYAASKAFVYSFAEAVRSELTDSGVTVTALLPGPTDTQFFDREGATDTKGAEAAEKNDPADVARQGFEALMAGKDRVFGATSLATKFQGMISRFMPESIKAAQYDAMGQHGTRTK